jgi:hypothetical protein
VELGGPFESTGFIYEVGHFCDLLRSSRTESPIITHDMSRQMMSILDHARVAMGLVYPPRALGVDALGLTAYLQGPI